MAGQSGPGDGRDLPGAAGPPAGQRAVAAPPRHPARMSGAEGWIAELTRAGQAAALSLGRRLGLPTESAEVLSSGGNLLLHFAPAPVVARVATLSAWSRAEPLLWLAREISVAGFIAGRGGPAVP